MALPALLDAAHGARVASALPRGTEAVIGRKDDDGKPDLLPLLSPLLPARAVAQIVTVLEHGAARYGADNWRNVEPARYRRALVRHVAAGLVGGVDADTGQSHWAHAACCLLFLLELE